MPIDAALVELLACPVTRAPLGVMPADRLDAINTRVQDGALTYADGRPVEEPLAEALVTQDGQRIYRVNDGIPVLLAENGIEVEKT
jgi:uncharacterized protein YbaR (Trm112 family)